MLHILLVLGPLVVAMLVRPIMVSAQPISARVNMLQARAEPRETSNLPRTLIQTPERRHLPSHSTPQGAGGSVATDEAALRKTLKENEEAADVAFSQGFVSFEQWKGSSNRAIEALQKLVKQWNKPVDLMLLRTLSESYLEHYLILLKEDKSGQHLTQKEIDSVTERAKALHDMPVDAPQRKGWVEGWEHVLQLMKDLKVGNPNGQLRVVLSFVETLIDPRPSVA